MQPTKAVSALLKSETVILLIELLDCTNEGGILAFFGGPTQPPYTLNPVLTSSRSTEIQQILKEGKNIEKVHDKEAAVKYFKFDKDQWVSYDDAETFDQKVKWADSVGLGGLMSWAIDLDDDHFTALSGLIGRNAGEGLNKTMARKGLQGASWSSDNGMCEDHT